MASPGSGGGSGAQGWGEASDQPERLEVPPSAEGSSTATGGRAAPAGDGPQAPDPQVVRTWTVAWARAEAAAAPPVDPFPPEAGTVVAAVLAALAAGGRTAWQLQAAGAQWAQAHRSVAELVERLARLRALLRQAVGGATSSAVAAGAAEAGERVGGALPEDIVEDVVDQVVDQLLIAATSALVANVERLSRTDPLTGVGNRRAFDEAAQRAVTMASRLSQRLTMVVVDLDGLKQLNDQRGHAAGDAALRSLVAAFGAALRGTDTVYRVGGDEFVLLLPFSDPEQVQALMDRVAMAGAPPFTWGAASLAGPAADAAGWFAQADRALYERRHALRQADRLRTLPGGRRALEVPAVARRWAWVPAAVAAAVVALVLLGDFGHTRTTSSAAPRPTARAGRPVQPRGTGRPVPPPFPPLPSGAPPASSPTPPVSSTPPSGSGAPVAETGAVSGASPVTRPSSSSGTRPTPPPNPTSPPAPTPPPSAGHAPGSGAGSGSSPGAGSGGGGAGPVGALVGAVGHLVAGVPLVGDLITTGPGGQVDVAGLLQLGGGQAGPATTSATTPATTARSVLAALP